MYELYPVSLIPFTVNVLNCVPRFKGKYKSFAFMLCSLVEEKMERLSHGMAAEGRTHPVTVHWQIGVVDIVSIRSISPMKVGRRWWKSELKERQASHAQPLAHTLSFLPLSLVSVR